MWSMQVRLIFTYRKKKDFHKQKFPLWIVFQWKANIGGSFEKKNKQTDARHLSAARDVNRYSNLTHQVVAEFWTPNRPSVDCESMSNQETPSKPDIAITTFGLVFSSNKNIVPLHWCVLGTCREEDRNLRRRVIWEVHPRVLSRFDRDQGSGRQEGHWIQVDQLNSPNCFSSTCVSRTWHSAQFTMDIIASGFSTKEACSGSFQPEYY